MELPRTIVVSGKIRPLINSQGPGGVAYVSSGQTRQVDLVSKTLLPSEVKKRKETGTHFIITDPKKDVI
jgi:hypothetical protein